jgi:hypothetical protein
VRATLALSPVVSIALSMLLLLGAAVILRYVFDLVKHAKSLGAALKKANDRLQDATVEIRVEAEEASERVSKLGRKRQRSRG